MWSQAKPSPEDAKAKPKYDASRHEFVFLLETHVARNFVTNEMKGVDLIL